MSLIYLIPLLPFIGFVVNGLSFPRIPKQLAAIIGTIPPLVAFILSIQLFVNFDGTTQILHLADWIKLGDLQIPFDLQIDALSIMMLWSGLQEPNPRRRRIIGWLCRKGGSYCK